MRCPCGLGPDLVDCCGRFHCGDADAPTAGFLMRSRYSAFAVGDEAYLSRSWHPTTRPRRVRLDPTRRWFGLEVLDEAAGGLLDDEGTVEFIARHDAGALHEHSRFLRHEGRWTYLDGTST